MFLTIILSISTNAFFASDTNLISKRVFIVRAMIDGAENRDANRKNSEIRRSDDT
jgi:hypothetical protein